jgi:hypothetical protein
MSEPSTSKPRSFGARFRRAYVVALVVWLVTIALWILAIVLPGPDSMIAVGVAYGDRQLLGWLVAVLVVLSIFGPPFVMAAAWLLLRRVFGSRLLLLL